MKDVFTTNTLLKIIPALMLLWALVDNPYSYYQILRWVVAGVSLYFAFTAYSEENTPWAWIFGITAILFNPIAPIHLARETWQIVDVVVAVMFGVSTLYLKKK